MTKRIVAKLAASALTLAMCAGCSDPVAMRVLILTEQSTGRQYAGRLSSGIVGSQLMAILDASGKPVCKAIARAEAAQ